jgi:hypothetical protein
VREEEEDRPLLKKLGAVRVANGTKRCAWISGSWTRVQSSWRTKRLCIRSRFETNFQTK